MQNNIPPTGRDEQRCEDEFLRSAGVGIEVEHFAVLIDIKQCEAAINHRPNTESGMRENSSRTRIGLRSSYERHGINKSKLN